MHGGNIQHYATLREPEAILFLGMRGSCFFFLQLLDLNQILEEWGEGAVMQIKTGSDIMQLFRIMLMEQE